MKAYTLRDAGKAVAASAAISTVLSYVYQLGYSRGWASGFRDAASTTIDAFRRAR